mmetsp:Transcript_496/g.733  ORF Transcript_496/g.733 Transcript_496/m.733 type:complete len:102 (-) Transcript_496:90-395(-)
MMLSYCSALLKGENSPAKSRLNELYTKKRTAFSAMEPNNGDERPLYKEKKPCVFIVCCKQCKPPRYTTRGCPRGDVSAIINVVDDAALFSTVPESTLAPTL